MQHKNSSSNNSQFSEQSCIEQTQIHAVQSNHNQNASDNSSDIVNSSFQILPLIDLQNPHLINSKIEILQNDQFSDDHQNFQVPIVNGARFQQISQQQNQVANERIIDCQTKFQRRHKKNSEKQNKKWLTQSFSSQQQNRQKFQKQSRKIKNKKIGDSIKSKKIQQNYRKNKAKQQFKNDVSQKQSKQNTKKYSLQMQNKQKQQKNEEIKRSENQLTEISTIIKWNYRRSSIQFYDQQIIKQQVQQPQVLQLKKQMIQLQASNNDKKPKHQNKESNSLTKQKQKLPNHYLKQDLTQQSSPKNNQQSQNFSKINKRRSFKTKIEKQKKVSSKKIIISKKQNNDGKQVKQPLQREYLKKQRKKSGIKFQTQQSQNEF